MITSLKHKYLISSYSIHIVHTLNIHNNKFVKTEEKSGILQILTMSLKYQY